MPFAYALDPRRANSHRCAQLQLRLAETEEQLAAHEEAASVVLQALAHKKEGGGAEHLTRLASQAHGEAVRALEHAARLRRGFADAVRGRAAQPARVASLRSPSWLQGD